MHSRCRLWVQAVWKLIHRRNVENTIPQHGIQPYVRSIISSHIAQFLKNISTRAADVEVFTQPGSLADKSSRAKTHRCPLCSKSGQTRVRSDCPLSVESRCGAVALGRTYLLPPLSSGGALMVPPWLRFHIPLIEPDRQISRIRLS